MVEEEDIKLFSNGARCDRLFEDFKSKHHKNIKY